MQFIKDRAVFRTYCCVDAHLIDLIAKFFWRLWSTRRTAVLTLAYQAKWVDYACQIVIVAVIRKSLVLQPGGVCSFLAGVKADLKMLEVR